MVQTDYKIDNDGLKLTIKGRLDADTVGSIWSEVVKKLFDIKPPLLEVHIFFKSGTI